MKSILSNWNLFRFIRLGLGVFILVQGIMTGDKFSLILGSLFTLMPLFNIGCCGAGGCGVNYKNDSTNNKKEISYEEVVDKK
jgi:hypothetical protein